MKKILLTLCTLLLVSGCGCSSGLEERGNGVYIHIKNNTGFDVYGLELKMENSSHMMINADGSKIEKGETIVIELLKEDVVMSDSEAFEVFMLGDKSGNKRIAVEHSYDIDFHPGQKWYFTVNGDSVNMLALSKEQ